MPSTVPVRRRKEDLQRFAKRIEQRMLTAKGPFAMEQLVCRLLTGKDQKVAAKMAECWVSWRYGKQEASGTIINSGPTLVMVGMTNDRMKALKHGKPELPELSIDEDSLDLQLENTSSETRELIAENCSTESETKENV